ncbi:hypothetical protein Pmani_001405 [Petrolisthes manimaculis]|uniref:DUF4371 domain-containing protein n=1 Tax=Petrolisthes manimaculis TaxID=1843537 RepID=A0AAE1UJA8_9EUCA|nr:hypothetical protein Pmani_028320 [Petrolisthes manimaculis]KAK4308813.1 hypothetical protein Pmani_019490 [Petrolisthes manimaculis]KAK4326247.1 hypothetical protein Pmani_003239 [Petrolisthes manimaculis]KAK4326988.1 hypothetical protein Pmani_002539 [Petrolisthes manimaculis]KAK4328165.1 hypothetical protein Pmani_001405 [Petrolisthes manimaculis]
MASTRQSTLCPVFGEPKEHIGSNLPTYKQVMKHFLFVKLQLKKTSYNPPLHASFKNVATHLLQVWQKASIPSVTSDRIIAMLKAYHDKYANILKTLSSTSIKKETFNKKLDEFKQKSHELFDISACKCVSFSKCSCRKEKKVPLQEKPFLLDQRSERKMAIGSVDVQESNRMIKKLMRSQPSTSKGIPASQSSVRVKNLALPESSGDSDSCSSDYEPSSSTKRRIERAETNPALELKSLAILSDKTGVSDRAAATIATVVLQEANVVGEKDESIIIDRHKIRRARKRVRQELQENLLIEEPLESIYFDGRKDLTKVTDGLGHLQLVREEHISLIQEPGAHYIGHLTPDSGTSKCIASTIIDFLSSKEVDTSKVVAIGCDGTPVNTGLKGGVIRLIEEKLGRPVHWFVCLLHANELPLRHLIHAIDGKTTGPTTFTGKIGKQLADCEKNEVIDFEPIQSENIVVDQDILSTDQKYLLMIYLAVSSGICPQNLAKMKPGKIHHARWLTTANRILRLYISTVAPSESLKILVQYIMKVYIPVWFKVKCNPSADQGAKHLHQLILKSQFLPEKYRTIVNKVIQNNSYFAHSENLLLAMIHDSNAVIRKLGICKIIKARTEGQTSLRQFKLPKLLFDAQEYHFMINWQTTQLAEPSLTKHLSTDLLTDIQRGSADLPPLTSFCNHTQAVERCIKMVTDASSTVVGMEARDGLIRSKLEGRKKLPRFETKRDYLFS